LTLHIDSHASCGGAVRKEGKTILGVKTKILYSEIAIPRKKFRTGHVYQFVPKVTPPTTFQGNYNKGCTRTLFDGASFQLQSIHIVTTTGYAFSQAMTKSLHAAIVKICTSGGDPLSHSCNYSVVARKMLPSFFDQNRWKSEGVKYRLYRGCGRTVLPNIATYSMAFNIGILGTHLPQTLLYSNVVNIISNA
jgi:hypothetical protein